ncbi:MAG: bifunctional pyr operon transcriptional regulator/uracil phosphoribosyltransferase PyrR [Actinobacteria bacterium]|nr:bifunctional pyr operon transcriptional regulator/uracil phosphoribosyltransferase PyrR [Actinomycetota bacterium]
MADNFVLLNDKDIERIIKRISHEIIERNRGSENLVFIGIHKRGVPLAERIAANIAEMENKVIKTGKLDISFYRDDTIKRLKPAVAITDIPFNIDNTNVILVDDVLFTGRTIRSALNALMDFGRPGSIQLVVLIDRGHRELPVRADYVGKNIPTALNESIEVRLYETDKKDMVTINVKR